MSSVPDDRIHLVSDGWVTLEGTVERWREREGAERDVWSLPGMRGAYNLIMVEAPQAQPKVIREAIEKAVGAPNGWNSSAR